MPSYNHERFISEAIESVLGQDFDDLELIIVDDASTDASRDIVRRYEAEDSKIRLVLHDSNLGIPRTLNDGNDRARGKFMGYIDSDDVWMKDKLSKQLTVLRSNENLIIWAEGELIDESGKPLGTSFSELVSSGAKKKSGDIFQELLKGSHIMGSTVLYKRANQGDIRWDERLKYAGDWKFHLDLAANYEFYYLAEPLAKYRVHADNASGGKMPEGRKKRLFYQDAIVIRENALAQYRHRMSADAKAMMLERLGLFYYLLGQNRKALMCYLRAILNSPFRRSNLQHPRRFLQFARHVSGPKA
jgi:teichuronic acid biosynthesis glycosyltransferase TuaG